MKSPVKRKENERIGQEELTGNIMLISQINFNFLKAALVSRNVVDFENLRNRMIKHDQIHL